MKSKVENFGSSMGCAAGFVTGAKERSMRIAMSSRSTEVVAVTLSCALIGGSVGFFADNKIGSAVDR